MMSGKRAAALSTYHQYINVARKIWQNNGKLVAANMAQHRWRGKRKKWRSKYDSGVMASSRKRSVW